MHKAEQARIERQYLGSVSFPAARMIQNARVAEVIQGEAPECLIFCEHSPCITLGKRLTKSAVSDRLARWDSLGVAVYETDRGGEITYHGPGQLVLYPVINLRRRRLGVKAFIEGILRCLAAEFPGFSEVNSENRPGIWIGEKSQRKLASVGLRIQSGITNHGFSLNVSCPLEIFQEFVVCGQPQCEVTSLQADGVVVESMEVYSARVGWAVEQFLQTR